MADEIRNTMTSSRAVLGQLIDVKGKQSAIQEALKDGSKGPGVMHQRNYEISGKMGLGSSEKVFRDQNAAAAAAAAAAMRQNHSAGTASSSSTTTSTSHLHNAATAY